MLTDAKINAAIKKATKETMLGDGTAGRGAGSLNLLVRPGKVALWVARWKRDGRGDRMTLGRYPALSLRDARKKFTAEVADVLAAGRNPKSVVPTEGRPTVERMFEGYLASLAARKARSQRAVRDALKHAKAALGPDRLASEIEPADVSAHLGRMFRRGSRVQADRARSYLHAAFNWAMRSTNDYTVEHRRDWGLKANPVSAVPKDAAANKVRDRALTPAELTDLWTGLGGDSFSFETGRVLKLVVCCGQRIMETLRVEGSEVDLERALWTIPEHKRKKGKGAHVIPLPRQAVEIFRELIAVRGKGALFPAKCGNADTLSSISVYRALTRWLAEDGCKVAAFQPRDLRRTWKTLTADAGIDRFTRDLIQQHARGDTGSKHYDRADYMPQMRAAMDKWDAWLVEHGIGEPPPLDLAQAA